MTHPSAPSRRFSFRSLSQAASAVAIVVGCLGLVGWLLDIVLLKGVLPGLATMKANTALAFLLAGVSLWLRRKPADLPRPAMLRLSQGCAFLVALVGVLTLSEYLFGWDLGIDQLLVRDPGNTVGTTHPGRMAPVTAVNFLLIGCALLFLDKETRRGHRPAQFLAFAVASISLTALVGYARGVESLYEIAPYASVALHTALTFTALAIGLLGAHPDRGMMAVITSDSAGGTMARFLVVVAVSAPLVVTWIASAGGLSGINREFSSVATLTLTVAVFLIAIWWSAASLTRMETERQIGQQSLLIQAAALEAAANGIIITDRQGRITWMNPAFSLLTGYTAEEAIGQNPRLLKSGQHDPSFYQRLWETVLAGQVWQGETINRRKDGSLFVEEQTVTPVRDERGEIFCFVAIKQDITDRKRTEAEIHELNLLLTQRAERLQALNRLSRVISSSLDLDSVYQSFAKEIKRLIPYDRMGVVVLNDAGTGFRMLEIAADRPMHGEPERIAPREERTDIEWVMRERQPHIEPDLAEARQFGEDEALLRLGIRSCVRLPLIVKGKAIGALYLESVEPHRYGGRELDLLIPLSEQLAIAIENARLYEAATTATTALKRAQAHLVETERLRAMGELAAGVAHDFNNALAGLLGQTLLIRTLLQADPPPTERIQEALARQEQAALDAAETVRRIREATRPRGREAFLPVALEEVVRAVVETTKPRWKAEAERQGRTITVTTDLPPVPPILGRDAELREALTNLLLNAVDALPTGGRVTISTTHVPGSKKFQVPSAEFQVKNLEPGTWNSELRSGTRDLEPGTPSGSEAVELSVTDTGAGMAEAVQARLFEPFFTTKGVRGSGLGLSMVQGIVRRHAGEIRIASAPGAGTTVTLRFPTAAEASLAAAGPPPALPALPHPLKILVIDDVFELAQVCCALLTAIGHAAEAAAGGQAGLQRLQAERFDLVLTDLGMAEVSGWDVASAVKARRPACPVILVTGWGDEVGTEHLAGTGVDLVLPKPYTRTQLEAALAEGWARAQQGQG